MLSAYFPYIFMLCFSVILYTVIRIRRAPVSILLWLPTVFFLLCSIPGHLCLRFAKDPFSSLYLFHALFVEPWERGFIKKLFFCMFLSFLLWMQCRVRKEKALRISSAMTYLAMCFLFCSLTISVCRTYGIPDCFFVKNDASYLTEVGDVSYYRSVNYGRIGTTVGYLGKTSQPIEIHEEPDSNSPIVSVLPADEVVSLIHLDFTYATTTKGWRYLIFSGNSNFQEFAGIRGFVNLDTMLDSLARGQENVLYGCFARYRILSADYWARQEGAYVTGDYAQVYVPLGLSLSVFLFLAFFALAVFQKWQDKRSHSTK